MILPELGWRNLMRKGWSAEAGDIECVLFAQEAQHLVERNAGIDDVWNCISVEVQKSLTGQLAAFNLVGKIARMLENEATLRNIQDMVMPLEFVGAALYYPVNTLWKARYFTLIVLPWKLQYTALKEGVVVLIERSKHALGVRGEVCSDLVGLHATKGGYGEV
jgi:hypothetical protein